MRKASIRVTVDYDLGESQTICKEIEPFHIEKFAPIDVCDDDTFILFPDTVSEAQAQIINVERKGFANDLSKEISNALYELMTINDTKNGYKERSNDQEKS
jgi:hypothetical protein